MQRRQHITSQHNHSHTTRQYLLLLAGDSRCLVVCKTRDQLLDTLSLVIKRGLQRSVARLQGIQLALQGTLVSRSAHSRRLQPRLHLANNYQTPGVEKRKRRKSNKTRSEEPFL